MQTPKLLSLAAMQRATGKMLYHGDSRHWRGDEAPTMQDLTECLFFSPGDGRIWMHDQRMALLHGSALGSLRRDLIDSLGMEKARGYLTRMGYVSGVRDAQLVRERWPKGDGPSIFAAGTRLHSLEGMVKVEAVSFEFDVERGIYDGEFLWHHSIEDDEQIAAYGVGTEAACWTQLGYAIGYVSSLFGRLVIFREVECRSTGSAQCRVIGKTAEQWGDVEEDLRYLNASDFASASDQGKPAHAGVLVPMGEAEDSGDEDKRLIGASSAFNAACHSLRQVAPTQATVLFTGESGVGKELFAYMLHQISPRSSGPFIAINCAAIPENLIEAELFGVERGAYTGATLSRPGRFERACGGALFLDEIGSLSLTGQGKLLRALQEREIERVGGVKAIKVDVRVIAATNEDLREAVRKGQFREDLFYRLNVFPVRLPPLRERRDDIPLLTNFFLRRYCRRHGRNITGFTLRAMRALLNYDFPGNIRELQNLVERGVIAASEDGAIDLVHMFSNEDLTQGLLYSVSADGALINTEQAAATALNPDSPLLTQLTQMLAGSGQPFSINTVEARLLQDAVEQAGGNLSAAARTLGLSRAQLAYRLKHLGGGEGAE